MVLHVPLRVKEWELSGEFSYYVTFFHHAASLNLPPDGEKMIISASTI